MRVKANEIYLDFDESITVERQSKVFESFQETSGDFSYSFELPNTAHNRKTLSIPHINQISKQIFRSIQAELVNDQGLSIYRGSIKVEGMDTTIRCSFFSGNTNWINKISGSILDFDYSDYDVARSDSAIVSTWNTTNVGTIFPIVDRGALEDRIEASMANNSIISAALGGTDFQPFFFVKTIFKFIFNEIGVKLSGDLLEDFLYQNMIITSNRSEGLQSRKDERTSVVGIISNVVIPAALTKLILTDTGDDFSDGSKDLWDDTNSQYVADVDMLIYVQFGLELTAGQNYRIDIYVNGVSVFNSIFVEKNVFYRTLNVDAGDVVEFYLTPQSAPGTLLSTSSIEIGPVRFDYVYISDYIPEMDKSELVLNVFKQLGIICEYDPYTSTLDTKLFRDVKHDYVDISQYVSSVSTDYYGFIDSFYKKNIFSYAQRDTESVEAYNEGNPSRQLGNGSIEINNDNLNESGDVLEVSFVAPITYFNSGFDAPLVNLGYVDPSRLSDFEFTVDSVTDNGSGFARFNVSTGFPLGFLVGRVVEIFSSSNDTYNGSGILSAVGGGGFELAGVPFSTNATAKFTMIRYEELSDSSPIVLINTFVNIADISGQDAIYVGSTPYTTNIPYAWFDRPRTGRGIDSSRYSLAFDPINQVNSFQIGLIDNYYPDFKRLLSDPIKIVATCVMPYKVYQSLSSMVSVNLKYQDFEARFYINKITGYENSFRGFDIELIKQS